MSGRQFSHPKVREQVAKYPKAAREKLLELRALILDVARRTEGVGELEETLKWNEPSFLTSQSKSGSTIRMDWKPQDPERVHLYFKCTSRLLAIFRDKYPDDFAYTDDRQISFRLKERLPVRKLRWCIEVALTYHLRDYKQYPLRHKAQSKRVTKAVSG